MTAAISPEIVFRRALSLAGCIRDKQGQSEEESHLADEFLI